MAVLRHVKEAVLPTLATRQPALSLSSAVKPLPPLQVRAPLGASTLCGSYATPPQLDTAPVAHWSWRLGGFVTQPWALAGAAGRTTDTSGATITAAATAAHRLLRFISLLHRWRDFDIRRCSSERLTVNFV